MQKFLKLSNCNSNSFICSWIAPLSLHVVFSPLLAPKQTLNPSVFLRPLLLLESLLLQNEFQFIAVIKLFPKSRFVTLARLDINLKGSSLAPRRFFELSRFEQHPTTEFPPSSIFCQNHHIFQSNLGLLF